MWRTTGIYDPRAALPGETVKARSPRTGDGMKCSVVVGSSRSTAMRIGCHARHEPGRSLAQRRRSSDRLHTHARRPPSRCIGRRWPPLDESSASVPSRPISGPGRTTSSMPAPEKAPRDMASPTSSRPTRRATMADAALVARWHARATSVDVRVQSSRNNSRLRLLATSTNGSGARGADSTRSPTRLHRDARSRSSTLPCSASTREGRSRR